MPGLSAVGPASGGTPAGAAGMRTQPRHYAAPHRGRSREIDLKAVLARSRSGVPR